MIALYRKELRALWPLGLLAFVVLSGDVFERPFTERLDEKAWEDIASYVSPGDADTFGWMLILLAGFVAYAAFPREHDERTIRFLHALPIRPRAIFAAKVAAGLTVLFGACAVLMGTDGLMGSMGAETLTGGHWRARLAFTHLALQCAFCFVAYAHGLFASVLRLFGLIPYALLLVVAHVLEDVFAPAAWIDPTRLLAARYHGAALVVPWGPLAAHLAVALGVLGAAYLSWMGPADRVGRGLERARRTVVGKLALGCGTVVAVLAVLVLLVVVSEPSEEVDAPEDPSVVETPSFETRTVRTERWEVTYPVSHEARARALIDEADALHEAVRRRLGADVGPTLVADLTEVSGDHRGIASWTHVRVGLVTEPDLTRLRRVLAHETVHAFQHRLSDRRQGQHERATRFFAEGSAEYLSYEVVPGDRARDVGRLVAAGAWERHGVRFEDLVDDAHLRARYDTTLAYALGERWTAALVDACGSDAIGDALRAMGREDAPRGLSPRTFWEDTLRAAGCDLERVDAAFARLMEAEVARRRARIDALPRIGGGVVGARDGRVRIVALLDRAPEPGWDFHVRLRRGPDAEDTEAFAVRGRADPDDPRRIRFEVPRALLPAARFQLLFGVRLEAHAWPWSATWQWASAP